MLLCLLLIELLLTAVYAACPAYQNIQAQKSCRTSSLENLARKNRWYQNMPLQDSFFMQLQQDSLKKVETLRNDPAFQEIVTELQSNSSQSENTAVISGPQTQANLRETSLNEASLYIFVSFSMGEKAFLNVALDAKRFGATLILRGFREGSYLKTAQSLQNMIIKTGQGVIIDPELCSLFDITAVPTYILTKPFQLNAVERVQTPIHDKLQGHVSAQYALETFKKEGDLQQEAQHLLHRGITP